MDALSARLEIVLLRAARSVRRAFDTRLRPLHLNMTQASLLSFLRDEGPLTQSELADRLHIGRATVGTFVEGLEHRGLVSRSDDPADRRAWRVSLTEPAIAVVDAFDIVDEELRAEFRAGLTRQERHQLTELLMRVERNAIVAAAEPIDVPAPAARPKSDAVGPTV
jgi:DNA-binding MarR family transcriptional regulator